MVNAIKGLFITCDIPMAQFIINMNASLPQNQKFIIHVLDNTHLFVRSDVAGMIRSAIAEFREQNTYEKPSWVFLLTFYHVVAVDNGLHRMQNSIVKRKNLFERSCINGSRNRKSGRQYKIRFCLLHNVLLYQNYCVMLFQSTSTSWVQSLWTV